MIKWTFYHTKTNWDSMSLTEKKVCLLADGLTGWLAGLLDVSITKDCLSVSYLHCRDLV